MFNHVWPVADNSSAGQRRDSVIEVNIESGIIN